MRESKGKGRDRTIGASDRTVTPEEELRRKLAIELRESLTQSLEALRTNLELLKTTNLDFSETGFDPLRKRKDSLASWAQEVLQQSRALAERLEEEMNAIPSDVREADPASVLTSREREVLTLLADGKSNKEVGAALRISSRTVETHRARLMGKLQVHSISELIRSSIRHGIIKP